jgi:drug/metabolite transporter (DMT)-like permease
MPAADPAVALTSRRISIPLAVAAFALLWSSAFAVAKLAMADCPPLILLTVRFLLAGVIMLAPTVLRGRPWPFGRRELLVLAALGVANQAAYLGLGYIGMRSVSAGLAALIISANPVVTAVLAALLLGERMTWRKAVGLLLGLGGVALVVESRLAGGTDHAVGIAFTLAALASLVTGTILFKWLAPDRGLWVGNGVQSLAAGLALLPFAAGLESVGDIVPTWRLAAAFAYLVLLVSIFAYLIWFHLLSVCGATAASAYHFLMPPLGMLFGWLLLGEHVASSDLLGVIPVAVGIYLVTRSAAAAKGHAAVAPGAGGEGRSAIAR